MDTLSIVFAGTPEFALPALETVLASRHRLQAVYTQPDRPAGRGRRLAASPVKQRAEAAGVPVVQPPSLRGEAALTGLRALEPDLMVVVAYGLLLPQAVLDVPRLGCWNLHASLLPRWRGAAPIQRAILAGDRHTGVCLMRMEAGLDTGPVLGRRETAIRDEDTAGTLHDRLAALGATLLAEALDSPESLRAVPQAEDGVCYAHKLDKAEAALEWSEPAETLWRQVRAFNPWPGARARLGDMELKIWDAEPCTGSAEAAPGTIVRADASGIVVAAGRGALRLREVQAPGRRRQAAGDFLNARRHLLR